MSVKNKICNTRWPYYWLDPSGVGSGGSWTIFFGADFKNIPDIDLDVFARRTNECLDYIRKNCNDCRLIYRPHPDETDEHKLLNLNSFDVQKDSQIAETFLWSNRNKVKYVFSVCSTSSMAAFSMGLNSYGFYKYFRDLYRGNIRIFVDNYFGDLPRNFFIENLKEPLRENRIEWREDKDLSDYFRVILSDNKGPVWFTVVENRFISAILGLTNMIKKIDPDREVNLIISGHHRWAQEVPEELKIKFNKVLVFPRSFYSLRPSKLVSAIATAIKIRKFKIKNGSIFIGFAHHDFVENCFMSYNKDKFRTAFLLEATWKLNFKTESLGFDQNNFRIDKASFFYNHFLEPLLGLNRTLFVHHGQRNLYFIRLQKPIEEIFDRVYLINN
jgi:hypothetical protein